MSVFYPPVGVTHPALSKMAVVGWLAVSAAAFGFVMHEEMHTLQAKGLQLLSHILESQSKLLVVCNIVFVAYFVLGSFLQRTILGRLTREEFEQARSRLITYLSFRVLLVLNMFTNAKAFELALWFAFYGFTCLLRTLGLIAKVRFKRVSQSPQLARATQSRLLVLLGAIFVFNSAILGSMFTIFRGVPLSHKLVLLYEVFIIYVLTLKNTLIYSIFYFDLIREAHKHSTVVYYVEFIGDIVRVLLTMFHYTNIWTLREIVHVFDIGLMLAMFASFQELKRKITHFVSYRHAIHAVNNLFPDATSSELGASQTCAICLDDMSAAKKLPCGHMYHLACIRDWLANSSTCPTCRRNIFIQPSSPTSSPATGGTSNTPTATGTTGTAGTGSNSTGGVGAADRSNGGVGGVGLGVRPVTRASAQGGGVVGGERERSGGEVPSSLRTAMPMQTALQTPLNLRSSREWPSTGMNMLHGWAVNNVSASALQGMNGSASTLPSAPAASGDSTLRRIRRRSSRTSSATTGTTTTAATTAGSAGNGISSRNSSGGGSAAPYTPVDPRAAHSFLEVNRRVQMVQEVLGSGYDAARIARELHLRNNDTSAVINAFLDGTASSDELVE